MNQRSATPKVLNVGDHQCHLLVHFNSFWIQSAIINTTLSPLKMYILWTETMMHEVSMLRSHNRLALWIVQQGAL